MFQFLTLVVLMSALLSPAHSEEIQFETDGFHGEVVNGLTAAKPFLKSHMEPHKESPSRWVTFVPGQIIQGAESLLRTIRPSEFKAKKWPTERPVDYEAACVSFKSFIRLAEFDQTRAKVRKFVFKDGDRLTLLQYFSEGNALAKVRDEVCSVNLGYFTVSPDPDELPVTENWIKVESVDGPGKGSWLLIDDSIECL